MRNLQYSEISFHLLCEDMDNHSCAPYLFFKPICLLPWEVYEIAHLTVPECCTYFCIQVFLIWINTKR